MRALVPLFVLALPILEIVVFILVGKAIGVLPTIGLILLAVVVGAAMLRRQGLATLRLMQAESRAGRVPAREIVHGALIVVAGILLVIPGFISDVIGLALFIPFVREAVWRGLKGSLVVSATKGGTVLHAGRRFGFPGAGRSRGGFPGARVEGPADVVDLSDEDFERRPNPHSPWHDGPRGNNRDGEDRP